MIQWFFPQTFEVADDLFKVSQEDAVKVEHLITQILVTNGFGVQLKGYSISPIATEIHYTFNSNDLVSNSVTKIQKSISTFEAIVGRRVQISTKPNVQGLFVTVPHINRPTIPLGNLLEHPTYVNSNIVKPTKIVIGMDTEAQPVVLDINNFPHALISGTTGSGKTVLIHTIIMSLLANATPAEINFVMIDPKQVEFAKYKSLKGFMYDNNSLCFEVAKSVNKLFDLSYYTLEARQRLLQQQGVVNIEQYNDKVTPEKQLPYVIIIIDELADLIASNKKEVTRHLLKIAQKGRAFGMHLICATQRPSADIVPSALRVNLPMRIGLRLPDRASSRIAIDNPGCEVLEGKGDGWCLVNGIYKRFQTAMVTDLEIDNTIEAINDNYKE